MSHDQYLSGTVMIVLAISVFLGCLSTGLMVVSVATDYWEHTDWNGDMLKNLTRLNRNASVFSEKEHFYKVVLMDQLTDNDTHRVYYLRSSYGGIWRICDYISEEFKEMDVYKEGLSKTSFLSYNCFHYIQEYGDRKLQLDEKTGVWLVRMQNSAASCMIVSLMCLLTAAITGTFGVVTKQVSSCMVTGVMYIVGGVFVCFGLVIMHTKVDYSSEHCSTLDRMDEVVAAVCEAKTVSTGWSLSVAWVAFAFLIIAFIFWLLLARCLRLEKAKSML